MRRKTIFTLLICIAGVVNAESTLQLPGDHEIGARSRYQDVQDPWWGDATAWTTRFTLTSKFLLDENEQWQLLFKPNYVVVHNDNYNSVAVMNFASPIVDTEGFNLNQANLVYNSDDDWKVNIGRQSLSYDNERMVGALEYWQTPQSFDAVSFDYNDHINWHVQYAYTNKVHRIYGRDSKSNLPSEDVRFGVVEQRPGFELGKHKLNASLLNVEYKTENNLQIVAYNYLLNNKSYAEFSTKTTGLRVADQFKPNQFKYSYTAEFAWQEDAYNNPENYQVWYNLIEAEVQYKSHKVKFGQETLSNENGIGFQTSLGTNHKFQGWADVFDAYAVQRGLRDSFVSYRGRQNKFRWRVVYHKFNSFEKSKKMGYEIDVELAYRLNRKWEFKTVYADFHTSNSSTLIPSANFDLTTWFISVAYNI